MSISLKFASHFSLSCSQSGMKRSYLQCTIPPSNHGDNGFCCVFISLCQSVLCICLCPSSPQSSVFSFFLSPPSVSSLSILSFSLSLICFCLHLLQFSAQSGCLYLFHLNIFFSCGFDRASPCRGIKTNFDQKTPQKTKHEKRFLICGI